MTDPDKPYNDKMLTEHLDVDFALKAAGLGVWEVNPLTKQVLWDDRCRALFGLAKDNVIAYQQAIQYIHPDDIDRVNKAVTWAMNPDSGGVYDQTYRTIGADDGLPRFVRFMGQSYFNETGELIRFAGVAQDATQQNQDQRDLQISELLGQNLFYHSPVAHSVYVGEQMTIQMVNQAMLTMWGRDGAVVGKPLIEALPELRSTPQLERLRHVLVTGETFRQSEEPFDLIRYGQPYRGYYDYIYRALRTLEGKIYGVLFVANEVTERVLARKLVEESEAYFRRLIDTAPAIIWETQPDGYCTYLNKRWYEVTGQTPAEAQGLGWLDATHPDDKAEAGRLFSEANQHQVSFHVLYRLRQQDGQYRWAIDSGSPRFDLAGRYEGMIGTVVDVHQQTIDQQALQESQARYRRLSEELDLQVQERTEELEATNEELAANNEELTASTEEVIAINHRLEESNLHLTRSNKNLEQFAYIASHDLQEPLRKIQQFGDLLKTRYVGSAGDELLYLERMQGAASRMSLLIKDLLTFSRISTSQVMAHPVPLNEVISQVMEDLSVVIEESGAQIHVGRLPTVQGDRTQLSQLFQNLLSNAVKFRHRSASGQVVMPRISVLASQVFRDEVPALVQVPRYAEMYHRIEVTDNGIGFDEKYTDRIFQVFQRLHGKSEFAGTGIGLAVVQKVVTNHSGIITASSQLGEGATFSVYLPV